jgi:single-strand DNA-binding protein
MYKNHVELIGFLGQDPELKSSSNGRAFTRLSVATTERWKDKEGEYQERTEWHTVFCWGKRAEAAARILKKGSHVLVEGQLRSRPVTNEGTGEVTLRWAIQANSFLALRPEKGEPANEVAEPEAVEVKEQPAATEDVPF